MKKIFWGILGLPMILLFVGCGEIEKTHKAKALAEIVVVKKFEVKGKDLLENVKDVDLNNLNLGEYGKDGKILLNEDLDFSSFKKEAKDELAKLVGLKLFKNPDGTGKDIPIRNKVNGSADLTQLEGMTLVAKDGVALASIKKGAGTKDEVFLDVKVEDILKLLDDKGKLNVKLVVPKDKVLPNLKDLDLETEVKALVNFATAAGSLSNLDK